MSRYDIERYLNVRSAYGASVHPDGECVSFLLNATGVPQVWTVTEPLAWPEQRTYFDERVTFASWSPTRPELIFGMDEGGNERAQLFRLDAESGVIDNLTRTPDAKHRWGGWSHDGDYVAFTSNRRDESVFDVYVMHRDEAGDDAELVYEGDGWLTVGGFHPDDSRVLVSKASSNFDQDLYSLELDSGQIRHLTPHEGTVRYQSVNWAPTAWEGWDTRDGVFLVTDEGSDTLYLAFLDLESLELQPVVDGSAEGIDTIDNRDEIGSSDGDDPSATDRRERPWNVDGVAVDDETGRFVYSRNVEGYTELTVGAFTGSDPTAFETCPEPDLPAGVAGGVSFGPNGSWFACSASSDTTNPNVYVVDVETGATDRLTAAPTAGIPRETFRPSSLVHVTSFDGLEVPAFFTVPREYETGETPVIVDIHGGPESQRRPSFSSVKQFFLDRGYAYFEPNVRGSAGYGSEYAALDDVEKRMDSVADVGACVEWLRTQPAVDPDRIACMGASYGGFMVLASLAEYPDTFAAGIDVVGIANFVTFLENTGSWRRALREAEYGSLETDRSYLETISPINNVESIAAPLFVLHGENDPRVPVEEAEQIVEKATERDIPVRKLIFEDEGHGFSKLDNRIEAYAAIADFLDEYV